MVAETRHVTESPPREAGFGIVEIVVSMLLLSLLAMAFLPLLVTSLKISMSNATLTTATQLITTQMDEFRSLGTTCSKLEAHPAVWPVGVDVHSDALRATTAAIVCPANAADYPAMVNVTVSVAKGTTSPNIAEATTLIFVASYS